MALGIAAVVTLASSGQHAGAQQPADAQAQAVLAAARQALGGDAALAAVKSFSVSGSLKMNLGSQTLDQALTIDCELPDKFLRERIIRSQGPGGVMEVTHRDGFNGSDLIRETTRQDPLGLPPPPDINPPRTAEEAARARERQVISNKQELLKLALALLAASIDSYPVQFTYGGQMPLEPGAVADVVEVKAADGFTLRLFVDVITHLPAMITWQQKPLVIATQSQVVAVARPGTVPVPRAGGAPPAATPPPPMIPPPAPTLKPPPGGVVYSGVIPTGDPTAGLPLVEHQLSLGDYRTSDGLTWPHRLTDRVEGQVAEDMKLGRFRINPKINPRTFKPSK